MIGRKNEVIEQRDSRDFFAVGQDVLFFEKYLRKIFTLTQIFGAKDLISWYDEKMSAQIP
jgi:hypothetical protein